MDAPPSAFPVPESPTASPRKGQLHGVVAMRLRRMIVAGDLAPGAKLRELALCKELGVSRTPVREAFRTLAAEGLVQLLPNRSVAVAPLDPAEIENLYVVFGALEGLAAELASARITSDGIAQIGRLLSRMVDHHDRFERASYMEVNKEIHRRVVEIANNPILYAQWRALLPRVERARGLANLKRARWNAALFEHTKMFAALAARDGPLLARLTREHFMNGLPPSLAAAEEPISPPRRRKRAGEDAGDGGADD